MAVVNGYCTTAQLRTHLKDDGSNLTTELLERAINASSRAVDRYCGRRFWQDSGTATRTYIITDLQKVFVDDISTRTGLVVAVGTNGVTFPTTLTADTHFILEPRNADKYASTDFNAYAYWQLRAVNGFFFPLYGFGPTLSVTARHGWSAIPPEVEEATILKAAALFKRKDAPFGVAGFNEFGAVRITRSDPDVVDLLDNGYRLPGFA